MIKARSFPLLLAFSLSACATLPDKKDVAVEQTRFEYASAGEGAPVVIFEAGLGGGMDTWAPVYGEVAKFTTVFAYNRRGYGESGKPAGSPRTTGAGEAAKTVGETVLDTALPGVSTVVSLGTMASRASREAGPRTGAAVVAELHDLLEQAGVHPPYVLAGHSLGGLYVSLYARTYPGEVAGVVLVDSAHPTQIERCKEFVPAKRCDPQEFPWWVKTLTSMLPEEIKGEMDGAPATGQQILSAGPLPDVPVVVLSHGKPPPEEPGMGQMWAALQQDIVAETRGTHIIAEKSGHNIQGDEPERVILAIRDLVRRARGQQRENAAPPE